MIIVIETVDDAAGALVALRSWVQEAPELKTIAGAKKIRAEQLLGDLTDALRTFRLLRRALDKSSDPIPGGPDGPSRTGHRGGRGAGAQHHPQAPAPTHHREDIV